MNKRLYLIEDEAMLVQAQTMHDNLVEDQAMFEAAYPAANTAATALFQAAINAAAALLLDREIKDEIQVLTSEIIADVERGHAALRSLGRYAIEAFSDDKPRQRVFGQDAWARAINDTDKTRSALELAYDTASTATYNAALLAVGYTTTMLSSLAAVAASLVDKQKLQKLAISERKVTTDDRKRMYNGIWQTMTLINKRAQLVWVADPARRAKYNLYPKRDSVV